MLPIGSDGYVFLLLLVAIRLAVGFLPASGPADRSCASRAGDTRLRRDPAAALHQSTRRLVTR